jgi:hypothetical protein
MPQLAGKLHSQEAWQKKAEFGSVKRREKRLNVCRGSAGRRSSAREALFLGLRRVDAFPPLPDYLDLSSSKVMI